MLVASSSISVLLRLQPWKCQAASARGRRPAPKRTVRAEKSARRTRVAVAGPAAAASAAVVTAAALDSLLGENRLFSEGKDPLAALRDGLSPCTWEQNNR